MAVQRTMNYEDIFNEKSNIWIYGIFSMEVHFVSSSVYILKLHARKMTLIVTAVFCFRTQEPLSGRNRAKSEMIHLPMH